MKPDSAEIRAVIEDLSNQPLIHGTARGNWPKCLFRVDDVQAAASILNGGVAYSRNQATQRGLLTHDAASPSVIVNSPDWIKDYVRLYFRPRTPTEFRSEGFRPKSSLQLGAHRPMPVVLIFDSVPVLTADGTCFTDGNAASRSVQVGLDADFLRQIPFGRVYHEGAMKADEKGDITFRRCAEALVPHELPLTNLRRVLCRSDAELETLVDLLDFDAFDNYSQMLGVSNLVHLKRWTFIETVEKSNTQVVFRFFPHSLTPEPFDVEVEFHDLGGILRGTWKQIGYKANGSQPINIEGLNLGSYRVKLRLDGLLAYSGTYIQPDVLL